LKQLHTTSLQVSVETRATLTLLTGELAGLLGLLPTVSDKRAVIVLLALISRGAQLRPT
jgi:hypothetical protein